jgi:hypothetical protein
MLRARSLVTSPLFKSRARKRNSTAQFQFRGEDGEGEGGKKRKKFEKKKKKTVFFPRWLLCLVTAFILSTKSDEEKIIFLPGATKRTSTRATVRGGDERKSRAASWPPSTLTTNADEDKLHCGRL